MVIKVLMQQRGVVTKKAAVGEEVDEENGMVIMVVIMKQMIEEVVVTMATEKMSKDIKVVEEKSLLVPAISKLWQLQLPSSSSQKLYTLM